MQSGENHITRSKDGWRFRNLVEFAELMKEGLEKKRADLSFSFFISSHVFSKLTSQIAG